MKQNISEEQAKELDELNNSALEMILGDISDIGAMYSDLAPMVTIGKMIEILESKLIEMISPNTSNKNWVVRIKIDNQMMTIKRECFCECLFVAIKYVLEV